MCMSVTGERERGERGAWEEKEKLQKVKEVYTADSRSCSIYKNSKNLCFYVHHLSVSAYLSAEAHVHALKLIKPTQLKASCYLAVGEEEVILWYTDHFGQNAGL